MRFVTTFFVWTVAGLTLGLALGLSVPNVAGIESLTVLSGSMEPTLHVGSVVLASPIPPTEARVGQIVTFHDPTRGGVLVSHRLTRATVGGGVAHMVTRGDANSASEEWSVPVAGTIGLVEYRIPLLGYAKAKLDRNVVRFVLLAMVPLTGLLVLLEIWRPRRPVDRSSSPAALATR